MAEEQLRKATGLARQGQTKEAIALVQAILKEDKNSVPAWWLMTTLLADTPERQKKALDRVLALDPKHKLALQLQAKLSGGAVAPASGPKPQPKEVKQTPTKPAASGEGLSWDKLEARDANKIVVDEDAASKMLKTVTYVMGFFVVAVVIGLILMVAVPAYQFAQINNPHDTVLRFYNSVLQGDIATARTMVCEDVQVDFDARAVDFTNLLNSFRLQFGEGAVLSYDLTGLTAEVLSDDGTNATVRVSGEYIISAPNVSEEVISSEITPSEGNEDVLRKVKDVWCIARIQ